MTVIYFFNDRTDNNLETPLGGADSRGSTTIFPLSSGSDGANAGLDAFPPGGSRATNLPGLVERES